MTQTTEKNKIRNATLYLVATPIGNLADLSERALKVLRDVDFIAAEDTRNTMKLLSCFSIRKEIVSYYEHNKRGSGERILARLLAGESCALVTDAGMPAISDPGEDIVRLCAEHDIAVTVVPGACAAICALSVSALATSKFAFEGFLSANKGERRRRLEKIKNEERTLLFYEAPHKLKQTLADLCSCFGEDRRISVCRELTKLNEQILRTTLKGAVAHYDAVEPRGEYVLVVEGKAESSDAADGSPLCDLSPEAHVAHYEGLGLGRMDAIKSAAKDRGMTKSELYKLLNG